MFKKILVVIGLLAFAGFANAESRLQKIQEAGNYESELLGTGIRCP